MKYKNSQGWVTLALTGIVIFIIGCGLFQNPIPDTTQTPTPGGVSFISSPVPANRCEGVSGSLEMQVLAGPAAAVGLEPFAVGNSSV